MEVDRLVEVTVGVEEVDAERQGERGEWVNLWSVSKDQLAYLEAWKRKRDRGRDEAEGVIDYLKVTQVWQRSGQIDNLLSG